MFQGTQQFSSCLIGRSSSLFMNLRGAFAHLHTNGVSLLNPILYFRIPHNTLCLPPKFCINHCFQMLLGVLHFLKSILGNKLCKIWGADRVYYGGFENSQ